MLGAECQSAQMSKITNDGLTQSGAVCFIAVPIWHSECEGLTWTQKLSVVSLI